MVTGYEQVRSIAAEIAGDHEAAAKVELVLPETGVCNGPAPSLSPDGTLAASGCCPVPAAAVSGCGAPAIRGVDAAPEAAAASPAKGGACCG